MTDVRAAAADEHAAGTRRRAYPHRLRRRPVLPGGRRGLVRRPLGLPADVVSGGGHLNPDSG
jgi:hypothetical protein